MFRILYAMAVVSLIGSTAWAATGLRAERSEIEGGVGIVLLVALQR